MAPDVSDAQGHGWVPVTRARTYELVLDQIEEQIASGRLAVGDRLPAERELAAVLGVSRVAVREAMRVLQAMGLITQGTGSGREAGTQLTAAPGEALTRLIRMHVLVASVGSDDLISARVTLERESARLAARAASPDAQGKLSHLLEVMGAPGISVEEFNDADTAFHVAIARASGNSLVAELTTALRNAMRTPLLQRLQGEADFSAITARLCAEHRGIYEALAGGDGERAADLVQAHIEGFYFQQPAEG